MLELCERVILKLPQRGEKSSYWQNLLAEVGLEGVLRGSKSVDKVVNY